MATSTPKRLCFLCEKPKVTYSCSGCEKHFCFEHLSEHRTKIEQEFDQLQNNHDQIREQINGLKINPTKHSFNKQIDQWGNGSFINHITYPTGTQAQPRSITVADFDNDSILDIIIVNYDASNVLVFIGHGDGSFATPIEIQIGYGAHSFSAAVGDFNNDKKLDFAVANNGRDNLEIYLQTC
jgi:hypothetical protein